MASMSLLQYTAWSDLGWWWWWCPLHTWLCQVLEESWVFQLGVQWEPSQRYCCNQQPVSWDYWFITGFMCCYSWGIPSVGSYTDGSDRYSPNDLLRYKWESCFTIQKSSWGYDRIDSDTFYNTSSLIKQLVSTVPVTPTISVATNWWNAPTVATHKTSDKPIVSTYRLLITTVSLTGLSLYTQLKNSGLFQYLTESCVQGASPSPSPQITSGCILE